MKRHHEFELENSLLTRSIALAICTAIFAACGGGGGGGGSDAPNPPPQQPQNPPSNPPPPAPLATVTFLHNLIPSQQDGGQPNGPLLLASDGNFYATTRAGGAHICRTTGLPIGCGAIVKITPDGVGSVLYSFGASTLDGHTPNGPLIQGQDGALYGVTGNGGANIGGGTVFRITLDGDYSVLYSFGSTPTDGIVPTGRLAQASNGDLYGVTASGGANECWQIPQDGSNCGTVFRTTLTGETTIVYSFGSTPDDGVTPLGGLLLADDGNLYGTTVNGGANTCGGPNSCGTVFRVTPAGVKATLHSFGSDYRIGFVPGDGIAPQGALIQGSDGALYGTTPSGGGGSCGFQYGCGTVFRITLDGELTILHAFAMVPDDGYGPGQYLIQATDGNFYGTTNTGGAMSPLWEGTGALSPQGTVFRMTPTGVKTTLHSFGPMNIEPTKPEGGVIQGSDGAFYGITFYSKAFTNGQGTVFRLVVN